MNISPENPTIDDSLTVSGSGRKPDEKLLFILSDEYGKIAQKWVTADKTGSYKTEFSVFKSCEYRIELYLVIRDGNGLIFLDRKTVEVWNGTEGY